MIRKWFNKRQENQYISLSNKEYIQFYGFIIVTVWLWLPTLVVWYMVDPIVTFMKLYMAAYRIKHGVINE